MADLVSQPTGEPTRKTQGAMIAGVSATSVAVVLDWVMSQVFPHLTIPAPVEVAIASIAIGAVSYFTKERAPA
jgi:uncharacterized membrane protein